MLHTTRFWLLPAAFVLSTACTAFFPPGVEDDGVERCDNVGDCTPPDDPRFDVECVFGEGQDEKSQKVCSPTWLDRSCEPDRYKDSDFEALYNDAIEINGVYKACAEENRGTRGCKKRPNGDPDGPCDTGLEENAYGVCDDPDAEFAAIEADSTRAGFDVLDQFCRSLFCGEEWVCDEGLCKQCEDGGTPGEGGCVEVYVNGQKSSVYLDDVSCGDDPPAASEAEFGEIPEPF